MYVLFHFTSRIVNRHSRNRPSLRGRRSKGDGETGTGLARFPFFPFLALATQAIRLPQWLSNVSLQRICLCLKLFHAVSSGE